MLFYKTEAELPIPQSNCIRENIFWKMCVAMEGTIH